MNRVFITDFSESRNQSGFIRIYECEFWRVSAEFWRIVANCSAAHQFTDSGHSARRNSLLHRQQNLEARVGIERSLRRQSASNTLIARLFLPLFYRGFKHFLTLSVNYQTYPVTYPLLARLLKKSLKVSLKVFWVRATQN